ncbi:MAG: Rieske 2Fe-2S domain-containing protein [Tomitella sp.]|nr:Rieske 2Fe-2S domain-containing protein [Tomitella sp.]
MAEGRSRVGDVVESVTRASERMTWLDRPSYRLEHVMAWGLTLFGGASDRVRNTLSGTYVGHPAHPALTALPVGAWSAAMVLDGVDMATRRAPGFRDAAELTIGVGVLGSTVAAATGLADWQYTHDEIRRAGMVHGIVNGAALGLCAASWRDRRRGRHGRARALSGLGYGLTVASSFLGGNLTYRHQVGVDHSTNELGPAEYVAVLPAGELEPGVPRRVVAAGVGIVLVAEGAEIRALGERCPHLGAPMVDGWLYRGDLVCPWHGSCFNLNAGTATRGPASAPLPTFEARERDGQVEVRRRRGVRSAPPGEVSEHEG